MIPGLSVTVYSDQLELDLFPGEPWNGRSPRGLTRAGEVVYFKRERGATRSMDPLQLEIWPVPPRATRKRRSRPAAGASTLLPLKGGRREAAYSAAWFGARRFEDG